MTFATCFGGLLLYAVHVPVVSQLPAGQYSMFATLLQVIHLMMIPSLALQSIYAEASASARSDAEKRDLTASVQAVLIWMLFLWGSGMLLVFLYRNSLETSLKIPTAAPLYFTGCCGLSLLWLPMFQGLMQGEENFRWLGLGAIINGVGRFVLLCAGLYLFKSDITGVMAGVFAGMMINLAVGVVQTRHIWFKPWQRFAALAWLQRAVPMTLALGAAQTMFCADMVQVQSIFEDLPKIDLYGFAGTIGRGLIILTAPIISVMFPKAVHGGADEGSGQPLRQALVYSGLLAGGAAVFFTIFPQLPVALLHKPSYLEGATLIPWFCWAMLPLVFATVLLSYLMARRDFRCVPWLLVVVIIYLIAMRVLGPFYRSHSTLTAFKQVIVTLGAFNILFLGVAIFFERRRSFQLLPIGK